jgi:hypothetical protein
MIYNIQEESRSNCTEIPQDIPLSYQKEIVEKSQYEIEITQSNFFDISDDN